MVSGCVKEEVKVTKVIDGDTFETSDGETIRLLGINTPEEGEYYYEEAKDYLWYLIGNKEVELESDKTNKDWYGRKLRYVYIDGKMVNSMMLERGYARLYLLRDQKYATSFEYAEKKARGEKIGVWRYT